MDYRFIEATDGTKFNHGKFMIMRPNDEDWAIRSAVDPAQRLLSRCGWGREHIMVTDLQTGEGAWFRPGGLAKADLDKHKIWVCPIFEPFLMWLYQQDLKDLSKLPELVDLGDVPTSMSGYRREGKS